VIVFQADPARSIDNWAETPVGLTLVVLEFTCWEHFWRQKAAYIPRSARSDSDRAARWMLWRVRKVFGVPPSYAQTAARDLHNTSVVVLHYSRPRRRNPEPVAAVLLAQNLGGFRNGFLGLSVFCRTVAMNSLMTASLSASSA